HDYFKAIRRELLAGGYEAMLYDLLNFDLSKFNHRRPPKTAAGLAQKLLGMSSVQRWWFDKLNAGRLLSWHDRWRRHVSRTELHDDYVLVMQKAGVNRRNTEMELAKQLRDHLCPQVKTLRKTMDVRVDVGEDKPRFEKRLERCWVLPSL